MTSKKTQVGHFLAKVLGIKLETSPNFLIEDVHGDETGFSADESTFIEDTPTTAEFLRNLVPTGGDCFAYLKSLFPCISWLPSYNLHWLAGDAVAGPYICLHPFLQ